MKFRYILLAIIFLAVIGTGAYIHFSMKATIDVFESNVSMSKSSFSFSVAKGQEYVEVITITNSGEEKCVYFDEVVEGPDPSGVDVSYKTVDGKSISSSNKLCLPAGTDANPSTTKVNIHISPDADAESGEYTIYIFTKET